MQSDGVTDVGTKSSSSNYILRVGDGTQLATAGSSSNFAAYAGYTYQTNTKPSTPESLAQYKQDGVTQISWPAGWTNTTYEVFKADISDPDPGDILVFQVEVVKSGEAFNDEVSSESSSIDFTGTTTNASASAGFYEHAEGYVWQARVKDLENYYSDWVTLGGAPNDYRVDLVPPGIPLNLLGFASPESGPTYVYLTWSPTTDALSGLAGYNVYRTEEVYGTGYYLYFPVVTETSTSDTAVSLGTNYYYVVAARDQAGNVGDYSNEGSGPHLTVASREALVAAPIAGGYSGNAADPVPGSTITYKLTYTNDGFAIARNIGIIDKVPPDYTEYKIGTATGEAIISVQYSSDEGATYTYTPVGTFVDPNVTNIKWLVTDESSGSSKEVEFGVVIR
jgi:uncharacterized repeat protein (TIGR01451 family)